MMETAKKRFITTIILLVLAEVLFFSTFSAAAPRDAYYDAEACYRSLRQNPQKIKYRHNWLRCIKKYQSVYKQDPVGPWAAAGLYKAAKMYQDLAKNLAPKISEAISNIHFYGAGCITPEDKAVVSGALTQALGETKIEIHDDLLAAARALFPRLPRKSETSRPRSPMASNSKQIPARSPLPSSSDGEIPSVRNSPVRSVNVVVEVDES